MRTRLFVVPLVIALALPIGVAFASTPPVGAIPAGPITQVTTPKGALVAVALPRKSGGLVWRLARNVDSAVLKESSEADVGPNVVIVFRAVGKGDAKNRVRTHPRREASSVTHVVHVR